jgi:GH24 family phage-related lysozyme (muramidase)
MKCRQTKKTDLIRDEKRYKGNSSEHNPERSSLQFPRILGNQIFGSIIQTRLTVSQPDDVAEQEADQVADEVMRISDARIQRRSSNALLVPSVKNILYRSPEGEAGDHEPSENSPQVLNEKTIKEIVAISLAESAPQTRNEQAPAIAWIYYNRWNAIKSDVAFNASVAYRNKDGKGLFKVWMYALGDETYNDSTKVSVIDAQNKVIDEYNKKHNTNTPHIKDIAEYVRYLGLSKIANAMSQTISNALLTQKNPYPDWLGQGNFDDLNRDDGKWPLAREYYLLQTSDPKLQKRVQVLPAKTAKSLTIIFDETNIQSYFKKNPEKLKMPVRHITSSDVATYIQRKVNSVQAAGWNRTRDKSVFQGKLTVGHPGDMHEQEADRVADQVMRMPEPQVPRQPFEEEEKIATKPVADTIGPLLQRQTPRVEEEEPLQAKGDSEGSPDVDSEAESRIDALQGKGTPLPDSVRSFMEPRFRADFNGVRLHTDADAAESARYVNAQAYTIGQNIVFGKDHYSPESDAGKRLLAHELTHVVQQSGGSSVGTATESREMSRSVDCGERNPGQTVDLMSTPMSLFSRKLVRERVIVPHISRQNVTETTAVLHAGTVRGSGLQFFPLQVVSTHIGPVSGSGGLLDDSRNRLSVIVGQSMTMRRIADILLPLWNSAAPFTPSGATGPTVTPPITADMLARGLLVYNRYYLHLQTQPTPSITGWQGGLRFPLPVEIDANGEATVNKDLIQSLAAEFNNAWEPLLDQPAGAVTVPAPANQQQAVASFLVSYPGANERGIALAIRAITNPVETQPFLVEVFAQIGTQAFSIALAFMDSSVNTQIELLASQQAGTGILGAIRAALAASPSTLTAGQQESLTRANHMLGLVTTAVPREMPFLQPTEVSAAGIHMIADFEGFCGNLYDDAMRGCGRGRGNCTIGFGHLIHIDPCDGRASEAPYVGGITRPQAEQLFAGELAGFANGVHNQITQPLNQQQFDAVVSFYFNTGRLNALLPDLNANQFANIPGIMNQFIRGRVGGQSVEMQGLVNRRAAESNLFSTGQYPP